MTYFYFNCDAAAAARVFLWTLLQLKIFLLHNLPLWQANESNTVLFKWLSDEMSFRGTWAQEKRINSTASPPFFFSSFFKNFSSLTLRSLSRAATFSKSFLLNSLILHHLWIRLLIHRSLWLLLHSLYKIWTESRQLFVYLRLKVYS